MQNKTRKLNVRLLLVLAAMSAIGGTGTYFWHGYQRNRNAGAFVRRADQQKADEDWGAEAESLHRYLLLVPNDVDARVRLAEAYDRSAETLAEKQRAVQLYSTAVALSPDNPDLRRRLARLLHETFQFGEALRHANRVVKMLKPQRDAGALFVKAVASHHLFRSGARDVTLAEVVAALEEAIEANEGAEDHLQLALRLAYIYRDDSKGIYRRIPGESEEDAERLVVVAQEERDRKADEVMDKMVEANDDRASAFLARYQYRTLFSIDLPGAEEDLKRALALEPDEGDSSVRLASAERFLRSGAFEKACKDYQQLIEQFPHDRRGYLGLARTYTIQAARNSDPKPLEEAIKAVRQGLAETDPNDFEFNAMLARLLIRSGDPSEANGVIETLAKILDDQRLYATPVERELRRSTVNLLRAEQLAAGGGYHRIPPLLRQVVSMELDRTASASDVSRSQEIKRLAYSFLGAAREKLGEWDRAAEAYDRAVDLAPQAYQLRVRAGRAYEMAGRFDSASGHFKIALEMDEADSRAWLGEGRALLRRQLALTPENRDWQPVEHALAKAEESALDPFGVKMFAFALAVSQEKKQDPIQCLKEAEAAPPQTLSDWRRLTFAYEGQGESDLADHALETCSRVGVSPVGVLLLRAEVLAGRGQIEVAQRELSSALLSLRGEDHYRVLLFLAEWALRQGDLDTANSHFEKLIEIRDDDLNVLERLCALALAEDRFEDSKKWESRLGDLEGDTGTRWRVYGARRLISQAKDGQDPRLIEAERLQRDIERMRPSWPVTFRLKGMLAERRGQFEEAISAFERAIELDRSNTTRDQDVARLVQILYPQGDEAVSGPRVGQLPAVLALSGPGSTWVIAYSVARGDIAQAVKDARIAVSYRPSDPWAHRWLGNTLRLAGNLEESETAFLEAKNLSPTSSIPWYDLLSFYQENGMPEKGLAVLDELSESDEMPEPERSLLLARGHQMLGNRAVAEDHFSRLIQSFPEDIEVLFRAGEFLVPTDIDRAEQLFRKAQEVDPSVRTTRHALASLLASRGSDADFKEAAKLLSGDSDNGSSHIESQRLLAQLFARRGGDDNLREAANLLEGLVEDAATASFKDRLPLAALYEAIGEIEAAEQQLAELASRTDPSPDWIATYAEFLVRHLAPGDAKSASLADETIQQLEKIEPASVRPLSLRARWLQGVDRQDEIEPLVLSFREENLKPDMDSARRSSLLVNLAAVYRTVDRNDLAEKSLREAAADDPKANLALVAFLAAQRSEEASSEAVRRVVESAQSDSTSQAAIVLCSVLASISPSEEDLRIAEPIVTEALNTHQDDPALLATAGSLRLMEDRSEEAIALFRRAIELAPANAQTMNNLAYLLAQTGSGEEALELVDRALGISGRLPSFLDTRAVALLALERYTEAVDLLEEISESPNADPAIFLHLALAYQRAGTPAEARKALDRANENESLESALTPKDRKLLTELQTSLADTPSP